MVVRLPYPGGRDGNLSGKSKRSEPKVIVHNVSGGVAGVKDALKVMTRKVNEAMVDRDQIGVLRRAAGVIVKNARCRTKNYKCEAAALLKWCQENIRWTRDVNGTETIQAPLRTMEEGIADCDCLSVLLAALGKSIGHEVKFRVIAADPDYPKSYSHVYVIFKLNGEWVPADPSQQNQKSPLGWESPVVLKKMDWPKGANGI